MAPRLTVVTPARSTNKPPRKLGRPGSDLWASVMSEFQITDVGGIQLLCAACEALDMAQKLRERVERDGPVLQTKNGPREHPCLKSELANRAFTVRTLEKLGITLEPLKQMGGQGRPLGWRPPELDEDSA